MAVAPRFILLSFWSVKARPEDRPAWISRWSSTRRSRCGRAAAGGVPSVAATLRRCAETAGSSSQRPSRIRSRSRSASTTSSAQRASGFIKSVPGDLGPGLAQLAEEFRDLVDLRRVLLERSLDQVPAAERVDALQTAGDLATLLVVERDRQLVDDRLGPAHAIARVHTVALAHRV